MKSLFVQTLGTFLGAFIIFIAIISLVFIIGLDQSVTGWNTDIQKETEEAFSKYLETKIKSAGDLELIDNHEFIREVIPEQIPVFIFDTDRELLFACRNNFQMGRTPEEERWEERYLRNHKNEIRYNPIKEENGIIGYFHTGKSGFSSNAANRKLLSSITYTLWTGIGAAFFLSILLTLLFSGRLSKTAGIVAEGINKIADGEFDLHIPEKGAREIIRIAYNANRLGQELKKEAELRSQWSQDITHDLRTPIAALKAQMEGMKDGVLDLTPARIELNLGELSRIEQLVEDLGLLTRLESPEMKLVKNTVPFSSIANALENRFLLKIKEQDINYKQELTVNDVYGDENLLLRAVSNILSNAIRHTPENKTVMLIIDKADETGGRLISLFNNGDIIPREEIGKLFDRLYRGEYARNTPGTGLGLAITKKIVELHKGSITIESREGYGTEVRIILPGK